MSNVWKEASIAVVDMEPVSGVPDSFILLKRHEHDKTVNGWCLPGGTLEPDETPEDAVCREVQEETGYEVDVVRKLFSDMADVNGRPYRIHAFLVEVSGGAMIPFPSEEHEAVMVATGMPELDGIKKFTRRAIQEFNRRFFQNPSRPTQ